MEEEPQDKVNSTLEEEEFDIDSLFAAEGEEPTMEELIHIEESTLANEAKTPVLNIFDKRGEKEEELSVFKKQAGGELSEDEAIELYLNKSITRTGQRVDKSDYTVAIAVSGISNIKQEKDGKDVGVNQWLDTKAVFFNISQGRHFGFSAKNADGALVQFPRSVKMGSDTVSINPHDVAQLVSGKAIAKGDVAIRANGFDSEIKKERTYNTAKLLTRRISQAKKQAKASGKSLKTDKLEKQLKTGAKANGQNQDAAKVAQP